MNEIRERWIADWFQLWSGGWVEAGDELVRYNLAMKQEHTARVVELVSSLAEAEGLTKEMVHLCRITAWLHDVGRFPQFFHYRTFSDAQSCSHAELSVRESELGPLSWLCPDEAHLVRTAVALHSAYALPADLTGQIRLVCQLLRDADKLDIWQIVLQHYEEGTPPQSQALGADLALEGWNPTFVEALLASRCAVTADKKSITDLRLLQLGWVFDISSTYAYRYIWQQGYIERLLAFLPAHEAMNRIRRHLRDYLDKRVRGLPERRKDDT